MKDVLLKKFNAAKITPNEVFNTKGGESSYYLERCDDGTHYTTDNGSEVIATSDYSAPDTPVVA
ncbi:hypothetical protein [Lewinella cohaerens]|uniref:hypothetical protein n=1 Tax=Lewinella cohaerens TaxID=70995 RepID=UPI000365954B|nr:hypothetical protein [Lewinella cohaerens]